MDLSRAGWRKSSRSNGPSNCVEVGETGDAVAVRDSKDPDGPVLVYPPTAWAAFLTSVNDGVFDR